MAQTTRRTGQAPTLRDSVEQVWLAGLGALALTEREGNRLFRTLVKQGEGFEKDAKVRLRKAVAAAKEAPGATVDRIESGLDETMTGVLRRLGVPTKREITSLTRRVEGLATALEREPPPKRRAPARRRKAAAPAPSAPTR
jgi:poly(hydroxyalkanoate) granule-associated protein